MGAKSTSDLTHHDQVHAIGATDIHSYQLRDRPSGSALPESASKLAKTAVESSLPSELEPSKVVYSIITGSADPAILKGWDSGTQSDHTALMGRMHMHAGCASPA